MYPSVFLDVISLTICIKCVHVMWHHVHVGRVLLVPHFPQSMCFFLVATNYTWCNNVFLAHLFWLVQPIVDMLIIIFGSFFIIWGMFTRLLDTCAKMFSKDWFWMDYISNLTKALILNFPCEPNWVDKNLGLALITKNDTFFSSRPMTMVVTRAFFMGPTKTFEVLHLIFFKCNS